MRGAIPPDAELRGAGPAYAAGAAATRAGDRSSDDSESSGTPDDPFTSDAGNDPFTDVEPATARTPSTRRLRTQAAESLILPGETLAPRPKPENGANSASGDEAATAANARAAPAETETEADENSPEQGRAERALPLEALPRVDAVDADPYAPLGFRAGTFILRPSVETGLTASSNASRTPGGSSGLLSETTLRLNAQSDWSEHSAGVNGYGTFRKSVSGEEVEDVEGGVDANLLLDLGHEWRARGGLSYSVRPESPSSPDAVLDADEQSLRQVLEAEAGLDKDLGPLRLGGTVSVERDWYGDADLRNGETLSQSGRDSTLALLKLRTGYELSPAITPFVEVEGGRRVYDEAERDSTRLGARAGLALDLREKLAGEFSAGYLREGFDDDDLQPIQGLSLDADLRWSPVRGTAVALNAGTTVEGTTEDGESGSIVYDLRLDVERVLRANLTGEAAFGASLRDYSGSNGRDLTLIGELGATWWLNRNLGLSGRLRHERLDSNLPGREYQENSVFLGTRLQY